MSIRPQYCDLGTAEILQLDSKIKQTPGYMVLFRVTFF